jgi:type IX secretion system PorP/SprF family membrane protein
MRRTLLSLLIFTFTVGAAMAQQRPQYTQYVFNNYLLNPALSGIENYTDVMAGYRSQWTGLQGAPVTSYLTFNTPIGDQFINGDASAFPAAGGENPSSRLYTQYYQAAEPHHGIGFTLVTDKAGPITQTDINATYAYHLGISATFNLALGVAAGVSRTALNTSEITTEYVDPAIYNGKGGEWSPDLGAGIWGYSSNYYFGISAQQILPQNLYYSTTNSLYQNKSVAHFFFTAGYKFFMSDDLTFIPSFMIKEINPVPVTYDITGKISFRDVFWIGGSYRHDDSVGILAGFNLSSLINVGYSYDITTSALNTVSNGTHEIVLSLLLNNRNKVQSPQHQF